MKSVPYHSHSLSCHQSSPLDSPRGDSAMQMPESHPAPSATPTPIHPVSPSFQPPGGSGPCSPSTPVTQGPLKWPGPGTDLYHSAALMAGLMCAERARGWEPNRPGQGWGGPSSPLVRRGEGSKIWRPFYPDCPEVGGERCLLRLPLSTWNSPLSCDTQPTV